MIFDEYHLIEEGDYFCEQCHRILKDDDVDTTVKTAYERDEFGEPYHWDYVEMSCPYCYSTKIRVAEDDDYEE